MFGLIVCDPPDFQMCIGYSEREVVEQMCLRLSTPEDFTTVAELQTYVAELNAGCDVLKFFCVSMFEF